MKSEMKWLAGSALAALAVAATAIDTPGTPRNVRAVAVSPTQVRIDVDDTCTYGSEVCALEYDVKRNDFQLSEADVRALMRQRTIARRFEGLAPGNRYCFRVYARNAETQVRSVYPSAWACADTPFNAPSAPLDVRVHLVSPTSRTPPTITWSAPDQSGARNITDFRVEQQHPPGEGRPWISVATVAGPNGIATDRVFRSTGEAVDDATRRVFRVCSHNSGGLACSPAVPITFTDPNARAQADVGTPEKISSAARDATLGAGLATNNPSAPQRAQAQRIAPDAAPALGQADLPNDLAQRDDNAIIIVGGRSVRAGDVKRQVIALSDNAIIVVGGRSQRAAALKQQLLARAPAAEASAHALPAWSSAAGRKPGEALSPTPQPLAPSAQPIPPSPVRQAPQSAFQR